jgi:uncharacterized protein (TIGR02600 family)
MRRNRDLSHPCRNSHGIALIIVLAAVVLVTVLVLAFLTSIGTELQSSKMYANGSSVKLLSQSAVAFVMGEIQAATSDQTLCWASQPGMIRTYNNDGSANGYYKLYSDDGMNGTGPFNHTLSANLVPTNWPNQKGVYIDLNQPVSLNGTNYYPILDGNSADYSTQYSNVLSAQTVPPANTISSLTPLGKNLLPAVTGFWLNSNTPVDTTSPNVAPMPVKWLYVLKKGEVIVPDSNPSNNVVTFVNAGIQPSSSDPIVGRMAFWTDDETCKVNINTASEGTFWDTPRTWTAADVQLALNQPAQNEFQRYPGHPGMVSLSAVFNGLTADTAFPEDLYPITPRVIPGGSKEGTTPPTGPLVLRSTRLYATPDELLFQPSLASGASGQGLRNLNYAGPPALSASTELDQTAIEKAKFFITANSEAPDVNVFNLPRVSLWPITLVNGASKMTAFDQLIAFCSTINNNIFYFQRQDPTSAITDLPSAGSATGLGRNRQLLEYLRTFLNQKIPGFGIGTFAAKYSNHDSDQILTEMFDYIRCTNLLDSETGATPYAPSLDNSAADVNTYENGGTAQVVPILDQTISIPDPVGGATNHPRGFGRFPTVHQAFFVFIGAGDSATSSATTTNPKSSYTPPVSVGKQRVQAGFFLDMFDPSHGLPLVWPWYQVKVTGLDGLTWNGKSMGFPAGTQAIPQPYAESTSNFPFYGGLMDFRLLTTGGVYPCISGITGTSVGTNSGPDMAYPGTFSFSGGTITVEIDALSASKSATPVQTITFNFPPGTTFPVPKTLDTPATPFTISNASSYNFLGFNNAAGQPSSVRSRLSGFSDEVSWITSSDVVRALVATPGDMRLIAPRTTVPSSFYAGLTSPSSVAYSNSAAQFSHMLRFANQAPAYGAAGGQFVNGNYNNYASQYISPNLFNDYNRDFSGAAASISWADDIDVPNQGSNVKMPSGVNADWDNGDANQRDGAYINKADEGDAGSATTTPYFDLYYYPDPTPVSTTLFSPNRMMPSAGMFGSLPTGVWNNKPWQTLLFRPGPANHPGLGSPAVGPPYSTYPPDHLLLDLFNMPVVEPYAISEPLSTAGRINMNYLIVPFTYINRDTAVRAAMKAQDVTAIPNTAINTYKTHQNASTLGSNSAASVTTRYAVNLDLTMSQFMARFYATPNSQGSTGTPDIFHSASEICDIDLVPNDSTAPSSVPITRSNMDNYWTANELTGDNTRERPYANLYPLFTTKSNTYTVHFRVQTLKQALGPAASSTAWQSWREGTDIVAAEYRGSQTIERYIDPNAATNSSGTAMPDYAAVLSSPGSTFPPATPLSLFYKFRVVSTKQFPP